MSGSSLPTYRSGERIQGQALVDASTGGGGSMAALSRSFDKLGQVFGSFADDAARSAERERIAAAEAEASQLPMLSADGEVQWHARRDDTTSEGRAFNARLQLGVVNAAQIAAANYATTLHQRVGSDPDAFRAGMRAYRDQTLTRTPQWAQGLVGDRITEVSVRHVGTIASSVLHRQEANDRRSAEVVLRDLIDAHDGMAITGNIDAPAFATNAQRIRQQVDGMVRSGHITQAEADVRLRQISDDARGYAMVSVARGLIQAEGPEAALRRIQGMADDASWSPRDRERAISLVQQEINRWQSLNAGTRSEARQEGDQMWRLALGGGAVSMADMERVAGTLAAAGDQAGAAEMRERMGLWTSISDARTAPTADLQRRLRDADREARDLPTHEARWQAFRRGQIFGEMLTRRQESMRRDPLGTAAAVHERDPAIGRLAPLDFSSPNALGAGLVTRAQQARRLGALEGMADSMPVLTAAEGERFATTIRTGTRDEVLGFLYGLGRLPGDTAARTLDAVIPGEGREQDRRVGAFMAATAQMQRGETVTAREIIDGAFAMQNVQIGALQGNAFRDHLQQHPSFPAYANSPAALATIFAGAQALYAQRAIGGVDATDPRAGRTGAAGDLTTLNTTTLNRILSQIAPTVMFGRQATAAPPGMNQTQFDDRISSVPAHVLAGAQGENDGRPLTRDILLRYGQLVAVGDGRYQVVLGNSRVMRGGQPFVLDMRQDWPAAPPDDFRNRLRQSESGQQMGIVNREGFAGLYQFGSERLAELNFYSPAPGEGRNGWRGTFNIPGFPQVRTLADFRANPAAQEAVADVHFARIDAAIDRLPGAAARDRNGLRAVAHLGGEDGMRRYVETNGTYDPADSNGTRLSTYYRRFSAPGTAMPVPASATPSPVVRPPTPPRDPNAPIGTSLGLGGTTIENEPVGARVRRGSVPRGESR